METSVWNKFLMSLWLDVGWGVRKLYLEIVQCTLRGPGERGRVEENDSHQEFFIEFNIFPSQINRKFRNLESTYYYNYIACAKSNRDYPDINFEIYFLLIQNSKANKSSLLTPRTTKLSFKMIG